MGIVNQLNRRISIFLTRRPNLRRLITVLGITAVFVMAVFPVYYQKEIQGQRWQLWILIGLALIAGLAQLLPRRAGIDLNSFSKITEELRHAIMMMPVEDDNTSKRSFDDWKNGFDNVANLIERQVDGLLGFSDDDGVACNLMVVLPNNFSSDTLDKAAKLDDKNAQAVAPYEKVSSESDTAAILFIAGRGKRARTRRYPSIYLNVPEHVNSCLPGAPLVYHKLRTQEKLKQPPYEYIPNPQDKSRTTFRSGVDEDTKNDFAAYFTKYQDHMASFISIGLLLTEKQPIGVLNVDSGQKAFLDDFTEKITMALLTPYSEIAAVFAGIYVQRLTEWLENSDEKREGGPTNNDG